MFLRVYFFNVKNTSLNFKLQCLLNSRPCLSSGLCRKSSLLKLWNHQGSHAQEELEEPERLNKRRHLSEKRAHPTGIPNSASSSSDWFCPFSLPLPPPSPAHTCACFRWYICKTFGHQETQTHWVKWLPRNLISTLIFYQGDLVIILEWWRDTDKFRVPNEAVSRSLRRFSL